jgi:NADH:ubiquinone oxidoreductase subunit 5 (subunit L)/multisubunit Na+/H+ antiporter MnhA subunit
LSLPLGVHLPSVQVFVGSLLLVAAVMVFASGVAVRVFIGRRAESAESRRRMHAFRRTKFARVLFGSVYDDEVFDPDELDQMVLMPTIVLACGLCLTGFFLLGYRILQH